LEKAKTSVQEGRKLVTQRQKHIRLADRSEFGWRFVKEYETDQLADDEEYEKRINKAEKVAEKKVAAAKKKTTVNGRAVQGLSTRATSQNPNPSFRVWWSHQGGYPGFRPRFQSNYGGVYPSQRTSQSCDEQTYWSLLSL
jgi:hypothetical protein